MTDLSTKTQPVRPELSTWPIKGLGAGLHWSSPEPLKSAFRLFCHDYLRAAAAPRHSRQPQLDSC